MFLLFEVKRGISFKKFDTNGWSFAELSFFMFSMISGLLLFEDFYSLCIDSFDFDFDFLDSITLLFWFKSSKL